MSDALSEMRLIEDRLVFGSYPDVLSAGTDRERVLRSLASSYLYKDLLTLDGEAVKSVRYASYLRP